jgi:hypothetical protein
MFIKNLFRVVRIWREYLGELENYEEEYKGMNIWGYIKDFILVLRYWG